MRQRRRRSCQRLGRRARRPPPHKSARRKRGAPGPAPISNLWTRRTPRTRSSCRPACRWICLRAYRLKINPAHKRISSHSQRRPVPKVRFESPTDSNGQCACIILSGDTHWRCSCWRRTRRRRGRLRGHRARRRAQRTPAEGLRRGRRRRGRSSPEQRALTSGAAEAPRSRTRCAASAMRWSTGGPASRCPVMCGRCQPVQHPVILVVSGPACVHRLGCCPRRTLSRGVESRSFRCTCYKCHVHVVLVFTTP